LLVLVGWGAGELSVSTARTTDLDAVQDVAGDRSPLLTSLAHVLSFVGSGYVVAPLAVIGCGLLYRRGRRVDGYAVALGVFGAMALSTVVKIIVDRVRPPVHHLEAVSTASFPSGHATQSTALCLALLAALLAGKPLRLRAAAAFATAALLLSIAISRVYLGVHYPTDVGAGIVLGGTWSVLSRRILCEPTVLACRWPRAPRHRIS
jgi:undecaprenyl-diphosphatase